ncbi:MAG: polysaccharide pyruvyl transferase family protein [Alistipes sp.]|nr:polysaccharide pyruvyl transferase family protein [Alistipes sp.]
MKKKIASLVRGIRLHFKFGARLRGEGRRIFLLNVPSHGNLGDHMICRAARAMIRDMFGAEPFCFSTGDTAYGLGFLRRNIRKDDVLLLTGGGYMGSLWKKEDLRVRTVVSMFPDNRIVILPQTVFYDSTPEAAAMLREAVEIYGAHDNLTVAVRERASYDFAACRLLPPPGRVVLMPDMALYADPFRGAERENRILLCLRSDKERVERAELPAAVRRAAGDAMKVEQVDTVVPGHVSLAAEDAEIDRLLGRFASARAVVTDRLHGMIFAAICGTPVVALDNRSGKVRAVYEAWLADVPYVRFVESADDVPAAVGEFMASDERYEFDNSRFRECFAELKRIVDGE